MAPFFEETFGNPSSIHQVGRLARSLLDDLRHQAATVLGCQPSQVIFTSGGTESNNLAVLGAARRLRDKGRHLISSRIEHPAVLNCFEHLVRNEGFTVTFLAVDPAGIVDPASLEKALRPDTILVSVMTANNETGSIQPVAELGSICQRHGVVFHTDAVQAFGKLPFHSISQFNADLVSICSHKFHGPKGCGALFFRSPLLLEPILFGGGHESELRAGTENLPAIAGFVAALSRFVQDPVFSHAPLFELTSRLWNSLASLEGVTPRGSFLLRLPNTVSFTVSDCDSLSLLAGLDLQGICASSGSACSVGSLSPSHVLLAMGVSPALANSFVRLSLGRNSTADEVATVESLLPTVINQIRKS